MCMQFRWLVPIICSRLVDIFLKLFKIFWLYLATKSSGELFIIRSSPSFENVPVSFGKLAVIFKRFTGCKLISRLNKDCLITGICQFDNARSFIVWYNTFRLSLPHLALICIWLCISNNHVLRDDMGLNPAGFLQVWLKNILLGR